MHPLIFSKCTFIKMRFPNLFQSLNSRIAPTYFLENENENYTFLKMSYSFSIIYSSIFLILEQIHLQHIN